MSTVPESAIHLAVLAMSKAITFKTRVGACIYTRNGDTYQGFNMENKIHKGYHAEEVAIINSKLDDVKNKDYEGIVIVYKFSESGDVINDLYPTCASCRQYLWEYTNPDLLITVVNTNGDIMFEEKLSILYPYPYPQGDINYL